MSDDSAVIRVSLDTKRAFADLDAMDRRMEQSARAAQIGVRTSGGGGGGGAPGNPSGAGGGGGILGSLWGMGAGGLAALGLAGMLGGPVLRDATNVAGGFFGSMGSMASGALGLREWSGRVDAARQAEQATIDAFGASGKADPGAVRTLFDAFHTQFSRRAETAESVRSVTAGLVAREAADPVVSLLTRLVNAVERGQSGGAAGAPVAR